MRLKRLELQGFKSFLDRTILTFEPGITGVVGPNGCGKSNIVDAILWVMGEQSPKHLRGESMTDVIFNGSEARSATSMAEVSLVLDKEGSSLSPQFAAFDKGEEISITRRVYRDGAGEFLINKVACRLKDIHELFMDTGVGRRAYSIIEQGQIDRMINVKPEERRHLFEEVAGITKYKIKRREAEKKLDQTRQNMLRLQDILVELEKQIRSLKVQATRARKFKEIKSELESVDLFLLGRGLHDHRASLQALIEEKNEAFLQRSRLDAEYSRSEALTTELEVERVGTEKRYQELSIQERDLALKTQKFENQIQILEERRKYLDVSQEDNVHEADSIQARIERVEAELAQVQAEATEIEETLVTVTEEIEAHESSLRFEQEKRRQAQRERTSLQDKINSASSRQAGLESQIEFSAAKEADLSQRLAGVNERVAELTALIESQREQITLAAGRVESCAAETEAATSEAASVHADVQQRSQALSDLDDEIFETRERYHSINSRLGSLKELQENLEGYSPTAKEILSKLEADASLAVPLPELLTPDGEVEEQLEVLLGADMNTLVVAATEDARRITRLVQEQGLERVRVVASDELEIAAKPGRTPDARPVLERVRVKPGFERVAQWRLGSVYFCKDEDEVFRLRADFPTLTFIVDQGKLVAHDDRSLSTGNPPTRTGVFARRREIEELGSQCEAVEQELKDLEGRREAAFAELKSGEGRHAELRERLSALHLQSVELRKEREKVQFELNRSDRDQAGLDDEISRLQAQIEKQASELAGAREELETLSSQRTEWALQLEETVAIEQGATESFEIAQATLSEKKAARSGYLEKRNSLAFRVDRSRNELDDSQHRLESLLEQREKDLVEAQSIGSDIERVTAETETIKNDRARTMVEMAAVKEAFDIACQKLTDLRDQYSGIQKLREELGQKLQQCELRMAQEQASCERVLQLCEERYGRAPTVLGPLEPFEITTAPILGENLDAEWGSFSISEQRTLLDDHLKSIRDKVARYGEVNLTAIQEFDEVQKRHDFLLEQRTDLEKSIEILQQAITKIDESTKTRFEETFDAVNNKFQEIFPILFSGGKAELSLTDPDNLLESGVDIMVQPPGKRLQSISLLSGGEKALTAVSLVLSIFARKPSPFCLLDEVDAPLDDANVSRFNTVVRKMAEKTQFIVITHNKKTMEIAEALYGVTMERAGISKMTSVRLQ